MNHISSKYSPMSEAIFLLQTVAGSEGKEARINDIKRRCHHDLTEESLKKIDLVNRAEEALLDLLKDSLDEMRFYFKPYSKEESGFLFRILFLYEEFLDVEYVSADQWIDSLRQMQADKYYDNLGRKIFCYNQNVNDTLNMNECKNLEDVMKLILDMDFAAEEKLMLQDIILNRDKHMERVCPFIEAALRVVEQFKKELDIYAKQFYEYWTKRLDGKDFVDYLNQETESNIQMEKNALGWKLRPAFFLPIIVGYSLYIDSCTGEYEKEDLCTLGFLYSDDYSLSDTFPYKPAAITEEQALKLLKLLSDKSKFEILSYTSEKTAYGAELADMLSLTTATVSHHTSELHNAGLLNVEKQGNKIYYSKNQQTIDNLMEYLQKRL